MTMDAKADETSTSRHLQDQLGDASGPTGASVVVPPFASGTTPRGLGDAPAVVRSRHNLRPFLRASIARPAIPFIVVLL